MKPGTVQFHGVEHIDERPSEAVNPPHHDSVTGLGVLEELLHTGAGDRGPTARGDVGEDVPFLHAGFDQGVDLQPCVLASGADPCVSEMSHRTILPQKMLDAEERRHFAVRHVSKTDRAL